MKIASSAGVLGEKVKIDSIFNSLVNDQGITILNLFYNLQAKFGYNLPFLLKSQKWSLQIYKILARKKEWSTKICQPNLQSIFN